MGKIRNKYSKGFPKKFESEKQYQEKKKITETVMADYCCNLQRESDIIHV